MDGPNWFLEESGDEEIGYSWNLMHLENGRLRCVAQYLDEGYAEQGLSAHIWVDSLGSGIMRLAMEGIVFRADNGKVWVPPEPTRGSGIRFTKDKKPTKPE